MPPCQPPTPTPEATASNKPVTPVTIINKILKPGQPIPKDKLLPNGFFVIEHSATGRLVATAMATHNPTELHPFGAELGWVAGDASHKGKGLGTAVCAAVTRRLIAAGYTDIRLQTDDWRLPAIMVYLRLGYEPMLYCDGMAQRWRAVKEQLGWKE